MVSRVLIVEDGSTLLRNLSRALSLAGFEPLTATNAVQARAILDADGADIVCLDINLPDGDGLELLEDIRGRRPELPAIVMTGHDSLENRARAERLHADEFLVKPFGLGAFRDAVSRLERDAACAPMSRPRIVLYSHDGFGLGHLKRNANIAGRLVERCPGSSVLMIVGSPAGAMFDYPPGIDYLKLPSIIKTGTGQWRSRGLRIDSDQARRLRELTIQTAVAAFEPDLMLVDHMPTGVWRELEPTLEDLKSRQRPPTLLLGLRDILDAPQVTRSLWEQDGTYEAIERFYDGVLVYGEERMFDTARHYGLTQRQNKPVTYCGYVTAVDESANGSPVERVDASRRLVTVVGGGGYDAQPMMLATMKALRMMPRSAMPEAIFIAGPLMPAEQYTTLLELAAGLPVTVLRGVATNVPYLDAADLVVTMAGYNALVESLGHGKRIMVMPRTGPSAEQGLRTRLFAEHGMVDVVDCDADPSELAARLAAHLESPAVRTATLALNGADTAVDRIIGMLDSSAAKHHAVALV